MGPGIEANETCQAKCLATVAIVDAQPLFAAGLANVLGNLLRVNVVGIGRTPQDARQLVTALSPNIMFLDVHLPDSARTIRSLLRRCRSLKVIALVDSEDEFLAMLGDKPRVCGWIQRAASCREFCTALDRVCDGSSYTSAGLTPLRMRLERKSSIWSRQ